MAPRDNRDEPSSSSEREDNAGAPFLAKRRGRRPRPPSNNPQEDILPAAPSAMQSEGNHKAKEAAFTTSETASRLNPPASAPLGPPKAKKTSWTSPLLLPFTSNLGRERKTQPESRHMPTSISSSPGLRLAGSGSLLGPQGRSAPSPPDAEGLADLIRALPGFSPNKPALGAKGKAIAASAPVGGDPAAEIGSSPSHTEPSPSRSHVLQDGADTESLTDDQRGAWSDENSAETDSVDHRRQEIINAMMRRFCTRLDSKIIAMRNGPPSRTNHSPPRLVKEEGEESFWQHEATPELLAPDLLAPRGRPLAQPAGAVSRGPAFIRGQMALSASQAAEPMPVLLHAAFQNLPPPPPASVRMEATSQPPRPSYTPPSGQGSGVVGTSHRKGLPQLPQFPLPAAPAMPTAPLAPPQQTIPRSSTLNSTPTAYMSPTVLKSQAEETPRSSRASRGSPLSSLTPKPSVKPRTLRKRSAIPDAAYESFVPPQLYGHPSSSSFGVGAPSNEGSLGGFNTFAITSGTGTGLPSGQVLNLHQSQPATPTSHAPAVGFGFSGSQYPTSGPSITQYGGVSPGTRYVGSAESEQVPRGGMQNHLASPRNQGPLQQRKAGRGQPRDDEDDSDHDGRRKRSKHPPSAKAAANNAEVGKKFACPYFKRNRRKYHKWTSCPGPGWDEVHRVKTHLYRRHALPIQCPRCWEVFKSDNQLRSHLQQDPPCDIRESTPVEGFSKDQEKRLRSRKKVQNDMTDEDKWREIYMILFPDDDRETIPSPYYDELDEEADESSVGGSELEEYATFIRREMPTLVRRELEMLFQDQFQDVDERVRPRVADIVLNLQPRLLRLFKQSQSPLSGYGPQHEVAGSGSGSDPSLTPSLSQGTGTGTDWASAEGTDHEGALPLGAENFPFNVDDLFDFDEGAIDTNLNWHAPGQATHGGIQPQTATRDTNVNAWDYEFDKLMNPSLYPTYGGDLSGIYSHPETSNQEPALAPLTGRGDL